MPKKAIDILKSFFETGDRPTQAQFADLIDSFHHKDGAALINSKSYDPQTGAVNIQFTDNTSLNFTIPTSFTIAQVQSLQDELDNKVDKIAGKGLSANDFTNYFKNLLSAAGAHINDTDAHVSAQDRADWNAKQPSEPNKGLSTNDYDDDELQKVQDATDHIDDDIRHLTPESEAAFTENLRAYEVGEFIGESQTNVHRIFENEIYKFDGIGDPEDPADDVTYPFECASFSTELAAGRWVKVLELPQAAPEVFDNLYVQEIFEIGRNAKNTEAPITSQGNRLTIQPRQEAINPNIYEIISLPHLRSTGWLSQLILGTYNGSSKIDGIKIKTNEVEVLLPLRVSGGLVGVSSNFGVTQSLQVGRNALNNQNAIKGDRLYIQPRQEGVNPNIYEIIAECFTRGTGWLSQLILGTYNGSSKIDGINIKTNEVEVLLPLKIQSLNLNGLGKYANDAAAASGGVAVGFAYINSATGVVMVRLS